MRILLSLILCLLCFFYQGSLFADTPVYTEDKPAFAVLANQPEFIIKLKSNPSTGFSWFLAEYDDKLVTPVKHYYQHPTSQVVGASGYEFWTFRMKPDAFIVPRQTLIRLVYQRSWEALGQSQVQVFKIATGP